MEEYKQKSWFSRNWGWVLGGGCLTVIVIVIITIGGLVYKVSDSIKESEPYQHALTEAKANETVIELLGTPIETNGIGSTSYGYSNGTTTATLTIPIKGPKDKGNIVVDAKKIDDEWAYYVLHVEIDGETEVVNLLDSKSLE
jgi:hypothetical protein